MRRGARSEERRLYSQKSNLEAYSEEEKWARKEICLSLCERSLPTMKVSFKIVAALFFSAFKSRSNNTLWERTLRRRGCGLIVNVEEY